MNAQGTRIECDYAFYQKVIELRRWQRKQIRRQQFKKLGAMLFAIVGAMLVASVILGAVVILGARF